MWNSRATNILLAEGPCGGELPSTPATARASSTMVVHILKPTRLQAQALGRDLRAASARWPQDSPGEGAVAHARAGARLCDHGGFGRTHHRHGRRIEALRLGERRLAFVLPEAMTTIELSSRSFVPAHTDAKSDDHRALGLCSSGCRSMRAMSLWMTKPRSPAGGTRLSAAATAVSIVGRTRALLCRRVRGSSSSMWRPPACAGRSQRAKP